MSAPLPNWKTIDPTDRDKLLADYCKQGLTAQQIADRFLNCSRSAAIGRIHRLKLQLNGGAPRKGNAGRRKAGGGNPAPKAKAPARKPTKLVQQTSSWRGTNNPVATDFKARAEQRAASPGLPPALIEGTPIRVTPEVASAPASLKLDLMQLTDKTCRWPQGDPLVEGFHFCGNDTRMVSSYCPYHRQLSYIPATVRQRASLRSAERLK
ncbi:GcrA family cell cycle regulator [Mesorhizobium sp.]|uniref:GcrA family cell cycle regulator n=1 Tax=Mesorhizobium sp. TaxID=1871066 RepID=UPI000FEA3528|nr:GcrA family cell cycle regulator [Mesorhizobium sp.]RWH31624.1 MAG: hypothetical protein EOQ76_07360 [Mesorhizobium sp.]TIR57677.1 MAG: hypothetical protein E5X22_22910 [Mesorhizobium sp.]